VSDHAALNAAIRAALATVPEPCSIAMGRTVSLTQMGLVDAVDVADDGAVTITLCLTDAACVHFRSMQQFISDAVRPLAGVTSVRVGQTLDKLWTPDRAEAAPAAPPAAA
jgi:metal-sulfur cluster biosynthetic enzyme